MSDFVKEIHAMFDHIWDCEIDHPVFQDTVGELMEAVIQAYEKHKPTLSTNLAEVGTDCISRQQAIKAIEEEWDGCCSEYPATQIIYDTTEAIERLPIIQPKRGTWIDTRGNAEWYAREYRCSECGDTMLGEANFCPNCGADMRQREE